MKKYKVTVDGRTFDVVVEEIAAGNSQQFHGSPRLEQETKTSIAESITAPAPQGFSPESAITVESPMPGSIIDIAVSPGDNVKEGDVLVILEAMKMENEITAPRPGRVSRILVHVGDTVGSGQQLVEIA